MLNLDGTGETRKAGHSGHSSHSGRSGQGAARCGRRRGAQPARGEGGGLRRGGAGRGEQMGARGREQGNVGAGRGAPRALSSVLVLALPRGDLGRGHQAAKRRGDGTAQRPAGQPPATARAPPRPAASAPSCGQPPLRGLGAAAADSEGGRHLCAGAGEGQPRVI